VRGSQPEGNLAGGSLEEESLEEDIQLGLLAEDIRLGLLAEGSLAEDSLAEDSPLGESLVVGDNRDTIQTF